MARAISAALAGARSIDDGRRADDGERPLPMPDVTLITPIGRRFWSKIDGSIDAGFSYTRSSGIAQLNLNSDTVYRQPAFAGRG